MKISIDDSVVTEHNLKLEDVLVMLLIKTGANIQEVIDNFIDNEICVQDEDRYLLTPRWDTVCNKILLESDNSIPNEEDLIPFAKELMSLMPQGKMPDSPYYWKCNKGEICYSLQRFYKVFGYYEPEKIKQAVKDYVAHFIEKGDFTYMQLLRNFIYKVNKQDGEATSDLASYLENMENE